MTADQTLTFVIGMTLVLLAVLEYWRPTLRGVL